MYAKKRILIIERAEDNQKVLKLSLEMVAGWEVIAANSDREAFAILEKIECDAIILNLVDCDRLTTLKKLTSNPLSTNIPIIAIAAIARSGERSYLEKLGVVLVIRQMFNPIILVDRIAQKLNWHIVKNIN